MDREDYIERKMSITLKELKERVQSFRKVVDDFDGIEVEDVADSIFAIRRQVA
jgi:NADPH-dependent 7-cyano-7-deazaguanine reductase QueF